MTEDFEGQLKWFTKRLLQIRILDVKGFGLPIPFTISEIRRCRVAVFNLAEQSPKEHLEDLVEEIKRFYIKNKLGTIDDIKIEYYGNINKPTSVKIFGIDRDLLNYFIIKRLKINTSLFETKAGNSLFYVGIDTDVVLSSTEQSIFAKLREIKESNAILPYNDIFDIVAQHKGLMRESFINKNNDKDKRDLVARSTISYLLEKIKKSDLLKDLENDKIIKNESGEGYKLML